MSEEMTQEQKDTLDAIKAKEQELDLYDRATEYGQCLQNEEDTALVYEGMYLEECSRILKLFALTDVGHSASLAKEVEKELNLIMWKYRAYEKTLVEEQQTVQKYMLKVAEETNE